ncbi:TetR/AcrR family transcriptional regulator C-terminal domain-containing protein [Clavibacter nebraskensis]|uniref:Transcriptional regulator, TetR family n=3 Tax=Clavibacter nebraskensis TaxID=31963 RepID=A0AAI9EKJ8_9MICO|nr:TetR/AcrR family transcriptional regulator C-terminal domain-containing protein [Clavibacter nebraskensis]KXU20778.1 TetR family transcriptional regulator [Clavibacter nebraskensis]OAH20573.1 TetR family transcriptional regulator [Clavibacter nebraskensis]QGV68100.2 TetR/AcrR family transcriptional regulator C-terminal domain-containing protein [Clavibacter nebraskensis]QGV70891.2 TetR/AcrR family transcriptional regulator C-terminal domain-containing protein [Clavibacter nebraskensis]QGV73
MARAQAAGRHSRDDVARTALRILDEHGLPDFTMRRLGAALDVQPSALYWHFPDKQSLLAELADRIVAEAATATTDGPRDDWRERVRRAATGLRSALLAHRDGAEVVASTTAMGLGATAARDALSAAVAIGGFGGADCARAASAVLHFVLGHVAHEQQRAQLARLGLLPEDADDTDPARDFAFGVDLLVRGLGTLA